jgi:hypothetical protein
MKWDVRFSVSQFHLLAPSVQTETLHSVSQHRWKIKLNYLYSETSQVPGHGIISTKYLCIKSHQLYVKSVPTYCTEWSQQILVTHKMHQVNIEWAKSLGTPLNLVLCFPRTLIWYLFLRFHKIKDGRFNSVLIFSGTDPSFDILKLKHYISGVDSVLVFRQKCLF